MGAEDWALDMSETSGLGTLGVGQQRVRLGNPAVLGTGSGTPLNHS